MVTPPTVRAWGGCLPVPSRTVPLHAQSVAFSAQEGGREQQAVRKHKRSTGLVHAAGHVVSGWEQCAHAQHVGKRGFRHQSASWHTCRANMFAEHLKLYKSALIEFPRNVFWPGHACFARANGLGHPCFEYRVVNQHEQNGNHYNPADTAVTRRRRHLAKMRLVARDRLY